jgi:rubredoxin
MRCALCGLEFEERDAISSCEGCPLKKGDCSMLKCPSCGFENPGESQLLKMFIRWRNRIGTE